MESAPAELEALVRGELTRPAREAARLFAEEFRRRHGAAVAAVLFYGSCLRKESDEGVLDFYVLVDSYRAAYPGSPALAAANALYPPNVFYAEVATPAGTLRCKYAVLSLGDFARGTAPGTVRASLWARFSQPAIAVWTRDPGALEASIRSVAQAPLTAVSTLLPLLPAEGDAQRFRLEELWQTALRETYGAEMRPESEETIRILYGQEPERFDAVARLALEHLAARGELDLGSDGERIRVEMPARRRRRRRLVWKLRKPLAKLAYALQLLKTAGTFGDWLPYVLWKLERHTGTRLVASERQRRHPLIFGWPLLARALWRRDFR